MLAVYECIDLGLISMLKETSSDTPILDFLQVNHPVLLMDPIHDDTVYVYHAFGVHVLDFGDLLQCLSHGLRADDDEGVALDQALQRSEGTHVTPLLNTYSVNRRYVDGKAL
jgi:nucleoporin NUP82